MASRFDIALGKKPKGKTVTKSEPPAVFHVDPSQQRIDPRIQQRTHRTGDIRISPPRDSVRNFTSHLKLVNDLTGEEFYMDQTAGFNLSLSDSADSGAIASISISFSCPIDTAQRLLSTGV